MSHLYSASINVTASRKTRADVHAAVLPVLNQHVIVRDLQVRDVTSDVVTVAALFDAANDNEAHQIMADAGRATGRPWDGLRVSRDGVQVHRTLPVGTPTRCIQVGHGTAVHPARVDCLAVDSVTGRGMPVVPA